MTPKETDLCKQFSTSHTRIRARTRADMRRHPQTRGDKTPGKSVIDKVFSLSLSLFTSKTSLFSSLSSRQRHERVEPAAVSLAAAACGRGCSRGRISGGRGGHDRRHQESPGQAQLESRAESPAASGAPDWRRKPGRTWRRRTRASSVRGLGRGGDPGGHALRALLGQVDAGACGQSICVGGERVFASSFSAANLHASIHVCPLPAWRQIRD